jgi:glycosyltransferase involved in cell wall biosynthesis
LPNWGTNRDFLGGEQDTLDGLALSAFFAQVKPDIIHVAHVFEGFGDRVALPNTSDRIAGQITSATLYDLIPLLYQDHYFIDKVFRRWYMHRLAWLKKTDLLLAISESSRRDAIDFLGIEPSRIVTIYGGISSHFLPPIDRQKVRNRLVNQYGLKERFVLYTGGDDHRKNISGAIAGYAAVPLEVRKNCQLVIICAISAERKQHYIKEALAIGLSNQDLVFTGYVTEEDLVAFNGSCDLFLFPSLYEGLGLPVLEAMACGAPVIGGNNSSIKELIARPDALFDASSYQSIAAAITKGLSNKDYLKSLSEYGLVRSKEFSWEKTANLALDAFVEAAKRTRQSGVQCAVQGWLPRKRLAIFTPLPPLRSGIADYNKEFLPYLSRHFDIDLYVDDYKVTDEAINSAFRIFNAKDFESVA